jgi:hypothetical protein
MAFYINSIKTNIQIPLIKQKHPKHLPNPHNKIKITNILTTIQPTITLKQIATNLTTKHLTNKIHIKLLT